MIRYLVTLIHDNERIERKVIAPNSMQATRIGLAMMPATDSPLAIICKPFGTVTP